MTLRAHAEALYGAIKSLLGNHDSVQVQTALEGELSPRCPDLEPGPPDLSWLVLVQTARNRRAASDTCRSWQDRYEVNGGSGSAPEPCRCSTGAGSMGRPLATSDVSGC